MFILGCSILLLSSSNALNKQTTCQKNFRPEELLVLAHNIDLSTHFFQNKGIHARKKLKKCHLFVSFIAFKLFIKN